MLALTPPVAFETRRAASADGTGIAYYVTPPPFEGAPRILLAGGLGGHRCAWAGFVRHFGARYQLLTWDHRGLFGSERPRAQTLAAYGMASHVRDVEAILRAEGWSRASLVGWSIGVPLALELFQAIPNLAANLVLLSGVPGRPLDGLVPFPALASRLPAAVALAHRFHARATRLVRRVARAPSAGAWLKRLGMIAPVLDEQVFRELAGGLAQIDMDPYLWNLRAFAEHDARGVLPRVDVPVLVVCGERDRMAPRALAQQMARSIADAEMLLVPGGTHYAPVEYPDLVHLRVARFYDERGFRF